MYVVVQHQIHDPAAFWSRVSQAPELPAGVTLHSSYPSSDGSRAVCLWEADSVESVRSLVESVVGDLSTNDYFEVGAERAMGLPR